MTSAEGAAIATVAALLLPLLLAAALPFRLARPAAMALAPWAALPALILAVGLHGRASVEWRWAVFGVHLGSADAATRGFLLLTASLWLAAGLFARAYMAGDPRRPHFWGFFLATASGNVGLVLARDVASFYVFFALMTFSAYGLIVHDRTPAAQHAARVYLVMSLLGEMAFLTAFLLIVGTDVDLGLQDVPGAVAVSAHRELVVALLFAGFGVKAGAILLHMWLPLAHPVAPTPASAVLSGAMIKAGLLGWLRFLPLGVVAMSTAGALCAAAGAGAAFYAVAIGLTQRDPKTILAYSSVSQMGLMMLALGVGLASVEAAPAAFTLIVFYALHHAFAKGALFLGTGVAAKASSPWARRLVGAGLVVPALALAGAPLSAGALAKISLKHVVEQAPWGAAVLPGLLSVSAMASTLLLLHFLRRAAPRAGAGAEPGAPALGLWLPWLLLLVAGLGLAWRPPVATGDPSLLLGPAELWAGTWPVVAALAVSLGAGHLLRRRGGIGVQVPPGDLVVLVDALSKKARSGLLAAQASLADTHHRLRRARFAALERLSGNLQRSMEEAEASLTRFGAIGLAFLLFVVLLLAASFLSFSCAPTHDQLAQLLHP